MAASIGYNNVEVFTEPGIGTPFLEIKSEPGVTGFKFFTVGSTLYLRDAEGSTAVMGVGTGNAGNTGPAGVTGPRGFPGIGIQGINGNSICIYILFEFFGFNRVFKW
jgi:hypothetical protein